MPHRARLLIVLSAVVAALVLGAAPAAALRWARPVGGAVTRGFDMHGSPFAAGQHRGADFEAPRGTAIGAPCGGRVVVAGTVGTSGRVVTVACGPWRVSVMPLARMHVHRGATVRAGQRVGDAGGQGAHAGLHLGVRRAMNRFGYVDPLRFLPSGRPWVPTAPPPRRRPGGRAGGREPAPRPVPAGAPTRSVAPWLAWAGAALLLSAVSGGVVRHRRRVAVARRAMVGAGVVSP